MGKSWFSAVKKALSAEPKQQKPRKVKRWFGKSNKSNLEGDSVPCAEQQSRHAHSVAVATAAAAKAAVAAANAAAEVVRLTALSRFHGKSKEEIAAIKIQTAFRGYMARRALRAVRGLVRLKSLIQGKCVKRQASSTLQSLQTLARLQYQIRERRLRLSEDKQACPRQLQPKKLSKDFTKIGGNWDDSTLSRQKVEANMLNTQVATMRREKALAYAYTHQNAWKNSSRLASHTFMDPNNPHWGWSWLERWMAARPNEDASNADKNSVVASRRKNPSPKTRRGSSGAEDSKSMSSIKSEQASNCRHSICGSIPSTRDDESFTTSSCSQSVPGYMAPTQATRARARLSNLSPQGSLKKRLSFPGSPKRFSGPPKLQDNGNA